MQLTVREAARVLNVTENVIYRLVSDHNLPAEEMNGQYRFNRAELLEWATLHKREIAPEFFPASNGHGPGCRLDQVIREGGVLYRVPGADKQAVLREVIDALPLPAEVDREFLLQVFLARESLGSTGIGEGIALPHPRYPMVLPIDHPLVVICFLEQPIPYSAADQQPVHTLFVLVSPTVRVHLGVLARLAFALRDPSFRDLIRAKASAEKIIECARRLEESLEEKA